MSDREAFEKWAKEEAKKTSRGFNELTLERDYSSPDYYAKLWVNAAWRGWQASRQALSSCSENPNSSGHAKEAKGRIEGDKSGYGRIADPALEGKPLGYVTARNLDWLNSGSIVSVSVQKKPTEGSIPVYTHPVSAQKEIERWKLVAHDQAETISEIQGLVHANRHEQASVPDKRPSNCREKARQDGGSYPKSGCFSCGNSWLFDGCPHSHKQESAQ